MLLILYFYSCFLILWYCNVQFKTQSVILVCAKSSDQKRLSNAFISYLRVVKYFSARSRTARVQVVMLKIMTDAENHIEHYILNLLNFRKLIILAYFIGWHLWIVNWTIFQIDCAQEIFFLRFYDSGNIFTWTPDTQVKAYTVYELKNTSNTLQTDCIKWRIITACI